MTTTVLNTKISEAGNRIFDNSKYITTQKFNKLTVEHFAARLKQTNLMNKTDFDKKPTNFNKGITSNRTKHLEVQKKLNSLITKDYIFLGRIYFTSNDGSQSTFVYQPTLDDLELKKDKGTHYVLSCKSKGVYNSKRKPLYTALLHSIKLSRYRTGIKFDKDPLIVEQNNYLSKIVNVYIVNDLDAWPSHRTNSFEFKNCLFGATNIVKNSNKEKYVYSGYETTFDSAGSRSFDNDLIMPKIL